MSVRGNVRGIETIKKWARRGTGKVSHLVHMRQNTIRNEKLLPALSALKLLCIFRCDLIQNQSTKPLEVSL